MSIAFKQATVTPYQNLTVKPLAGALGAEIGGVDLSNPLDEATRNEILQAFYEYLVIYFYDQDITPEQHIEFAKLFGELQRIKHMMSEEGYPDLQPVRRLPDEKTKVVGVSWHNDSTYMETPPATVAMRAINVPEAGGDTLFANLYLAYETLSPKLRDMLCGLKAVHSATRLFGKGADQSRFNMNKMDPEEGDREVLHPVIRTHPVTGRKCLFVNSTYTRRFEGMTEEESQPLLTYLYQHASRPEFTCRVRWRNNMMLLWDNRCVYHHAVPDYQGQYRYLQRVTTGGEIPV